MTNATPMRLVIVILGLLGGIALVGALALIALDKSVPNEIWMIVTGAATAIGALLAQPSRTSDSQTTTVEVPAGTGVTTQPPANGT